MDVSKDPQAERRAVLQVDGAWYELSEPHRHFVAHEPSMVAALLAEVEAAAESGLHVAGYVAYEAAVAFGLPSHPPQAGLPLAEFVAFRRMAAHDARALAVAATGAPTLAWRPCMTAETHAGKVRRIREHLAAGHSYQVNLTFPLKAAAPGDPFPLFARLARAQRSSSAVYLDMGRFVVCSASPETFFARDGERVTMRPMKGTAPRGRTLAEDRRRSAALRRSPKERAENLMIVDMVRNDLGRLARVGSVQVNDLFRVERYPTVLQMTSTVTAQTAAPLAEIFAATFPCASVVGAPKVRTAELIREIEEGPRGIYTGAAGYVGPGRKARFNVAIRTATVDRLAGTATYGTGGGIVWDSRPEREYLECVAKARVLSADVEPFELLETMRWDPAEGYALLERHLRRQAASARYFGIPYDRVRIKQALRDAGQGGVPLRVRLLVGEGGEPRVERFPLDANEPALVRVGLARRPVEPSDAFLHHKTTKRAVYEEAKASRPDCDQVLLWTAGRHVTETNVANVAIERDGGWVTPPVSDGLLPGTLRAELLASGFLREGNIGVEEIERGAPVAVFNSLRGWQAAVFVPLQPGETTYSEHHSQIGVAPTVTGRASPVTASSSQVRRKPPPAESMFS